MWSGKAAKQKMSITDNLEHHREEHRTQNKCPARRRRLSKHKEMLQRSQCDGIHLNKRDFRFHYLNCFRKLLTDESLDFLTNILMIQEYSFCTVEAFSKSFHKHSDLSNWWENLNAFDSIQIPDVLSSYRQIIYDCNPISPNPHNEYVIKPGTNRNIIQIDDFNPSTARSS